MGYGSVGADKVAKTDDRWVVMRQEGEIIVVEHRAGVESAGTCGAHRCPSGCHDTERSVVGRIILRSLARATVPVREELPSFEAPDESLALIEDSEMCVPPRSPDWISQRQEMQRLLLPRDQLVDP